jgi:hypothetical protein
MIALPANGIWQLHLVDRSNVAKIRSASKSHNAALPFQGKTHSRLRALFLKPQLQLLVLGVEAPSRNSLP